MISDIKERIEKERVVLSTLPKNNKKNRDRYLDTVRGYLDSSRGIFDGVMKEIDKRKGKFRDIVINPDIDKFLNIIEKMNAEEVFLWKYASSYEIVGLDRVIFDISKFYKFDMDKVNGDICKAIDIFKLVGVNLRKEDFDYNGFVYEYMGVFFDNIGNLDREEVKKCFESIYWRCSDFIVCLEVCFRSLYFKYKGLFDSYVLKRKREIMDKYKGDFYGEYKRVCSIYEDLVWDDLSMLLDLVKRGDISLESFQQDRVMDSYRGIHSYSEGDMIDRDELKGFYYGLEEFIFYSDVSFIISEIKSLRESLNGYKSKSRGILKEIRKNENRIRSIHKKIAFRKKFKRDYSALTASCLDILLINKGLYDEADRELFNDRLIMAGDDISYMDCINIARSNFVFLVKCIKKNFADISDEEIRSKIDRVSEMRLFNSFTFMKYLNIKQDKDINMVISDGYSLSGFIVSPEFFQNYDDVCSLRDRVYDIILYMTFVSSGFTYDDVWFYKKVM